MIQEQEQERIEQRKERLLKKYPHLTKQEAEMYAEGIENQSKLENQKDVPALSPELEAQLKILAGRL
ncbi:MAG: hypothetical protein EAZ85_15030 [Bacteroidetes bacterium]|nr:MAG: hypothetical protein EAZ85_15030 [Bacteroidota bacterium]TAG91417.1 MAG: hypothetical protein EAZ20_03300 [Bacteroidota bacterium]